MQGTQKKGQRSTYFVQGNIGQPIAPLWEVEVKKRISVELIFCLEGIWVKRKLQ